MRSLPCVPDGAAEDGGAKELVDVAIQEVGKMPVGVCKGTHLAPVVFRMFERLAHLHPESMDTPQIPTYPNKVLLAWAEAISGNENLQDWLMGSDFPELGVFCHALRNETTSRAWLRHHGHVHLMALLLGTEGEKEAVTWLRQNGQPILADMAETADNDEDALGRLLALTRKGGDGLWAQIAVRIQGVKNDIEESNNDVHRIDPN